MTDKIQKIREGLERLKSRLIKGACASQITMETRCKEEAYNQVLTILDSMQEEPVSEDLKEAALMHFKDAMEFEVKTGLKMANITSFKAGAKWQKEQITAKAIDVEVKVDAGGYPYIPQMELYDYDKDVPLAKAGDKYKVVLINED